MRSDENSLERFNDMAGLLDSYGVCLTGHQLRAMELYYMSDCSLAEIAEELCISRQGAHELIRRSGEKLLGLEEKLGLAGKAAERHRLIGKLSAALDAYEKGYGAEGLAEAAKALCEAEETL